jgi:SAM-dependent methyltransferase
MLASTAPYKIKPYHPVVLSHLQDIQAQTILDAPCGHGWLGYQLQKQSSTAVLDGLGLWGEYPAEDLTIYRDVREHDLDKPLPALGRKYDAVVCGEALHLLTNPGLVLAGFADSLKPGGSVIITTPNTWHARSRGQFFLRGFHSGFSPNYGKKRGDYITYFPFSFPQLHLLLTHAGFSNVKLHEVAEPKPKRIVERLLALPGRIYCERKRREAETMDEAAYWGHAGSAQSQFGRWLVVSAQKSVRQ